VWDADGNMVPGFTDAAADPVGFEHAGRSIDPVRSMVGGEVRIQLTGKELGEFGDGPA
jgi:hypothetical protein